MTPEEASQVLFEYEVQFQVMAPQPIGVLDEVIAEKCLEAMKAGEPIAPDFDWWADLPEGHRA